MPWGRYSNYLPQGRTSARNRIVEDPFVGREERGKQTYTPAVARRPGGRRSGDPEPDDVDADNERRLSRIPTQDNKHTGG